MTHRVAASMHWAILIGINFYVEDRCLHGSVRDVESMAQYLKAGPSPVDITVLTATSPCDSSSRLPVENAASWPTKANLIEKLERVIIHSKPGDFVYFHYSGHGTRSKPLDSKYAHQSGNLAFVLFENDQHGASYLHGWIFAHCLRKMVDKGLHVTAVLDCCYSGSVLRNRKIWGTDVRAAEYDPEMDLILLQSPPGEVVDPDDEVRNSRLSSDQWLMSPDGYTILAACAPHEEARELELDGGERRGALSYFIIEALTALRKSGVELSNHSVYEHLRAKFHVFWPRQNPMLYGNRNYSFFGQSVSAPRTNFIPVFEKEGRLCLAAGRAHGVHEGDKYVIYPFETSEDATSLPQITSIRAKVEAVRNLTADLAELSPIPGVEMEKKVWKARAVASVSPRKVSV